MNDEQYKRFKKMLSENIECLHITKDKNNLYFLINASTSKHYKIIISNDGKIKCSCPDYINTVKIQECLCKHCLYIIYNILKDYKNINHEIYKRCYFSKDEIQDIYIWYKNYKRN
jgi:hypothetical protein